MLSHVLSPYFVILPSHLSRWQHRECETVLRTVSRLNQLEWVCYTCLLREFSMMWHGFRWVITFREVQSSLSQKETYSMKGQLPVLARQNVRLERISHKSCKSSTLRNTVFMLGFWKWYSSQSVSFSFRVIRVSSCTKPQSLGSQELSNHSFSVFLAPFSESAKIYWHNYLHLDIEL